MQEEEDIFEISQKSTFLIIIFDFVWALAI